MAGEPPIYCCDTSSLLHAWYRAYPPKSFRSFWGKIDELIAAERFVSSIEVFHELQKKDDEVFAWAKERKVAFLDLDDEVQGQMGYVMGKYPRLVDTRKGKSGGDPFVIALALASEPQLIVLHQETGGSEQSPKIPYVCNEEKLTHCDLLALIDQEGWSF